MGQFYGGPISELELVQFHLGVNIKYSQALSRDEHLSSHLHLQTAAVKESCCGYSIFWPGGAGSKCTYTASAGCSECWHCCYAVRGFTHTPAVLHAAAERALAWLARRDSKTHLPSQTIHCGQQTVTAEEDFLFAFLSKWPLQIKIVKETNWCVVQDSTVVHRPHE